MIKFNEKKKKYLNVLFQHTLALWWNDKMILTSIESYLLEKNVLLPKNIKESQLMSTISMISKNFQYIHQSWICMYH